MKSNTYTDDAFESNVHAEQDGNIYKLNQDDSLNKYCSEINTRGYTLIKNVYEPDDIEDIAKQFDKRFMAKLKRNEVQCRDYRRYACKLPISKTYEAVLNNPYIDKLMTKILGEGYVLSNFNSHSSLPGSSKQHIHVDSTDYLNTNTYVNGQTNVVFLHIPMINTDASHGATALWPTTLFKKRLLDTAQHKWVRDNLEQSTCRLSLGDVVVKRDNCFHAGGRNTSLSRRHMITLIFVRKNIYLNANTGVIPCAEYNKPDMPKLPYRVASHCANPPQDLSVTYEGEPQVKPIYSSADTTQTISFKQLEHIKKGIPQSMFDKIKADPEEFVKDPNAVFNMLDYVVPLAKAAFGDSDFHFHSIKLNSNTRELDCDDPVFKKYVDQTVFNNDNNLIKIHIPIEACDEWLETYPGNKVLSMSVLKDSELFDDDKETLSSSEQDLLVTTGALPYANVSGIPTIEISFVRFHFTPSYDDRFWVSDNFALTLPNRLGKLLRYDSIFITQEKYLDFKYSLWSHIAYVIGDQLLDIRMDHKIVGNLSLAAAVSIIVPPWFIKTRLTNHIKGLLEVV